MNVTLHLADCLDILHAMPDQSVDVVITDPPYGIGENNRKNLSRGKLAKPIDYGAFDWDQERVEREYFDEMRRVSHHQVIFGGIYYTDYLPPSSGWIVWDKNNSGDFADCELAWTSYPRATRLFRWMWSGFVKQAPEKRVHPTQKPFALMAWIVENYSKPGQIVMDPFMGSGTTGAACTLLARHFIGVEKDEHYFRLAKRRIYTSKTNVLPRRKNRTTRDRSNHEREKPAS
jgi:DNA modification methylase